jgi:MFS transporter, SET family, sugar efflux transporter
MLTFHTNPLIRPIALGIYSLFFLVGLVSALILPTFSLYLQDEIGARPLLIGLPFAGMALASIFYNHLIGGRSDKLKDRRPLIGFLCILGALSCLVFAFFRDYWLVASVAIILFSLAMVSFSQMLAYSLDYANRDVPEERVPLFNAIVRAQIAIAWVAGPPLGFFLATRIGFTNTYIIAAVSYLLIAIACFQLLPSLSKSSLITSESAVKKSDDSSMVLSAETKVSLLFAVIGFSLLFGVNNAYLISLPLHLKNDLQIDPEWIGPIMGLAAGLEIPFMILAGHFAARISIMRLIYIAAFSALCLYSGVYIASELWHFFALQVFNAVFIGVLAGLGVSVIQQLIPNQSGAASSLYTNTTHIGNLFSSLVVGFVADYFGYHTIFLVNLLFVVIAVWAFSRVKVSTTFSTPLQS